MKIKGKTPQAKAKKKLFCKCSRGEKAVVLFFLKGMRGKEKGEIIREGCDERQRGDDQLSAYLWLGVSPAPC